VLANMGWAGPVNYDNDTAKFSAVLRSWEDRFGVRVVAANSNTLIVSVAAPPGDLDAALHLAAEHFAFCPDNLWQSHPHTIGDYAPQRCFGSPDAQPQLLDRQQQPRRVELRHVRTPSARRRARRR
jgi:hypothetical protein